jgi:mono/diheme cytochrome c family protein
MSARTLRRRLHRRSPPRWLAGSVLAAALLCTGCPGNGKSIADSVIGGGDGGDGGANPATLAEIQRNTFGRICINCHFPGGPGPMPLTSEQVSYDSLVNVPSLESLLLRVAPGDPDNSYIIHKITGAPDIIGDRMPPPPEAALSPREIAAIREWIAAGAKP